MAAEHMARSLDILELPAACWQPDQSKDTQHDLDDTVDGIGEMDLQPQGLMDRRQEQGDHTWQACADTHGLDAGELAHTAMVATSVAGHHCQDTVESLPEEVARCI